MKPSAHTFRINREPAKQVGGGVVIVVRGIVLVMLYSGVVL